MRTAAVRRLDRPGLAVIITGSNASGKTTLLRAVRERFEGCDEPFGFGLPRGAGGQRGGVWWVHTDWLCTGKTAQWLAPRLLAIWRCGPAVLVIEGSHYGVRTLWEHLPMSPTRAVHLHVLTQSVPAIQAHLAARREKKTGWGKSKVVATATNASRLRYESAVRYPRLIERFRSVFDAVTEYEIGLAYEGVGAVQAIIEKEVRDATECHA